MELSLSEIASLIDAGKGNGYFENQIEQAFTPFFTKLQSLSDDRTKLTVLDIFKIDPNKFKKYQKRFEVVLEEFLSGFEAKVGNLPKKETMAKPNEDTPDGTKKQMGFLGRLFGDDGRIKPPKKKFDTEGDEIVREVRIRSIHKDVFKMFGDELKGRIQESGNFRKYDRAKRGGVRDKAGGFLGFLAKAGTMALGAAMLFKAFTTDGQFKGTFALLGKMILLPITKMFTPFVEKASKLKVPKLMSGLLKLPGLSKLAKLGGTGSKIIFKGIWGLGALISLGFAYQRFKKGDNLGGFLEIAAGISSLVPIVGTAISIGISAFLAWRDVTTTEGEKKNNFGGDMMAGIKDWFLDNKFFGTIIRLFQGIFQFFTAKNSGEVDDAIDLIKNNLGGFRIFSPILMIYDFFTSAIGQEVAAKTGSAIGVALEWIWESIVKLITNIGTYIGELGASIVNSIWFRKVKNKLGLAAVNLTKSIVSTFSWVIDIMGWLSSKMFGIIDNYAVKKLVGVFSDDGVAAIEATAKTLKNQNADTMIKSLEGLKLKYTAEAESLNKEGRKADKIREEKRAKAEEKRHKEKLERDQRNADKITDAVTNGSALVATTIGGNDSAEREVIVIKDTDGNAATRRLRDLHWGKTYGAPSR